MLAHEGMSKYWVYVYVCIMCVCVFVCVIMCVPCTVCTTESWQFEMYIPFLEKPIRYIE